MNLSEALDAALPEIPRTRLSRKNPPRLDPELIVREDVSDGEPIVAVYQRSTANLLRMKPTQWQLAQLFDGVRTYEEIAAHVRGGNGNPAFPGGSADLRGKHGRRRILVPESAGKKYSYE
jgi:hypothetical protein